MSLYCLPVVSWAEGRLLTRNCAGRPWPRCDRRRALNGPGSPRWSASSTPHGKDVQAIQNGQAMKLNDTAGVESQSLVAGPVAGSSSCPSSGSRSVNVWRSSEAETGQRPASELRREAGAGWEPHHRLQRAEASTKAVRKPAADRAGSTTWSSGRRTFTSRAASWPGSGTRSAGATRAASAGSQHRRHYTTVTGGQRTVQQGGPVRQHRSGGAATGSCRTPTSRASAGGDSTSSTTAMPPSAAAAAATTGRLFEHQQRIREHDEGAPTPASLAGRKPGLGQASRASAAGAGTSYSDSVFERQRQHRDQY